MIYTGPSGTETTYYVTPQFEVVHSSSGTEYRHYISANGRPVMVIGRTTTDATNFRSLLLDHQGSISTIVNASNATSYATESFTAYGNRREASTWSGAPTSGELTTMNGVTREGYTFQTVLGSMGLNHMNGRIEDAVTGRFLSPDPRGTIPGNTQSWNRYSYVINNPLTFIDPSGFCGISDGDDLGDCDGDGGGGDGGGGGGGFSTTSPTITPPGVVVLGNTCTTIAICVSSAPPDSWPAGLTLTTGDNGLQELTATASAIKPKTPPAQGKQYLTQKAAGTAGACAFNPISMTPTDSNPYGTEYSGFVYQNDNGTYSYTNAYPGADDSSGPSQAMTDFPQTPVAWFHTHGGYNPSFGPGNYVFSPDDIAFSNATGKPNYMANPANNVQVYNPSTRAVTQFGSCNQYQ